jgi:peptide/nickel transport system permease protein
MTLALDLFRPFLRKPVGLAGLLVFTAIVLMSLLAPFVVPVLDRPDLTSVYRTPSLEHPLGTDFQGRDVFNQIVHGGRDIVLFAVVAAAFSTGIAITLGALAATVGGRLDALLSSLTDVGLTLPHTVILIVIAAILRPTSVVLLAVILALLQCWGLVRQVRAQVLSLKERDYVEAARSLDLGLPHIIFREMLPNMRSYIVIHFILAMTGAIYAQTAIIILGLLPVTGQSWGLMLYFAQSQGALFFRDSFWYILSPILAISLLQLSLVSLASALEELFDPRLRSA